MPIFSHLSAANLVLDSHFLSGLHQRGRWSQLLRPIQNIYGFSRLMNLSGALGFEYYQFQAQVLVFEILLLQFQYCA